MQPARRTERGGAKDLNQPSLAMGNTDTLQSEETRQPTNPWGSEQKIDRQASRETEGPTETETARCTARLGALRRVGRAVGGLVRDDGALAADRARRGHAHYVGDRGTADGGAG